jgi:replicative DNA helicase
VDNELRLVSKAIRERDLKPALDRGIKSEWFSNPDAREVWDMAIEHWQQYGEVPTAIAVKSTLPTVTLLRVEDSYEYLLDEFVSWRRRGMTVEILQEAIRKIDQEDDHEAALKVMETGAARIEDTGVQASKDVDLTQNIDERIQEYLDLENLTNGMRGLATGFPTIDRATSGLQPGQLVTIVAQPKCGKSTLAMTIAKNIHQLGIATGLVSFEMSNAEQAARHDAMIASISHSRLMRGQMNATDKLDLKRSLKSLEALPPFHLIADPVAASTVSGLAAKIETYCPAVLFVDGVYLMIDEISGEQNTPQALTNITRNLKRLAQKREIPIVISTQALTWKMSKKKGVTADSIGYSSSFFQDSDVILGLQFLDDDEDPTERLLKVVASRNCPNVETTLAWDWEHSRFEEFAA